MKSIRLIVLLALLAPPVLAQQSNPAPATLTLRGVVVTDNDVPLPRVRVAPTTAVVREFAVLGITPATERGVLTDDRGQFRISVTPRTSTRLAVTKARYTSQTVDIPLREQNAQSSDIRVRMSLGGAISGQVFDRSGARLTDSVVMLQRVGAARSDAPVSTTRTNDIGEYRFGGLSQGRYVITARPAASALGADIPDRQAIIDAAAVESPAIDISAGSEVGNINLSIETPSELDHAALSRSRSDPEGTGSLSGRVVGWDGTPIARAVVHAYRPFIPGRQVETDARGRYRIDGLGPAEYIVEARKYGFDRRQYGQAGTATVGRPIAVKNGQAIDSIDVTLTVERSGVIAGTIVDEFGEPAQDVAVSALQRQSGRAVRSLGGARTDDRGQYRIRLLPGTYVVQAVVDATLPGPSGYLPQFYPGAFRVDEATATKVDSNATVTGIDLALIATTAHRVTGTVVESSGRAVRGSVALMVSQRSGAIQTEQVSTEISADGSFEFTNVAPGDYVAQANDIMVIVNTGPDGRVMMAAEPQFAMSFVTVTSSDPSPVQLKLLPGATLLGRIRHEGVPAGPTPFLELRAVSTDLDRAPRRGSLGSNLFSIRPDGSFEHKGALGPTLLRARPQQNDWYLKSVVVKGQDVTDTAFDFGTGGTFSDIQIVISAFGATVAGRVTDDRGAPVRDGMALVFPTLRDRWFAGSRWVKTERPAQDGTFTATGLPPGEYWVIAVPRLDRTAELAPDADVLESLSSRAVRISLGEGQSQDVTLRLIRP